ncbi:hypothetical protein [uncultured Arthrobacter sp.]|uniref:hypothetical protein n=1 Tax=uncultured Arthrobacter sp. TaxID=114050 RepID=UPI002603E3C0|nr:hypothetical protein [uncultured Arthrobacter sp.]
MIRDLDDTAQVDGYQDQRATVIKAETQAYLTELDKLNVCSRVIAQTGSAVGPCVVKTAGLFKLRPVLYSDWT